MGDSDAEELSVGVPSPPAIGAAGHHQHHRHHHHHHRTSPRQLLLSVDEDSDSTSYQPPPQDQQHHRFGSSTRVQHLSGDTMDSSASSTPGSQQSSSAGQQRHPTCALCKNHQQVSVLKGHKRYCPWRTCLCELCYSTNKKRKINAEQVAQRRAQAQDEELRRKGALPPEAQPATSAVSASPVATPVPPTDTSKKGVKDTGGSQQQQQQMQIAKEQQRNHLAQHHHHHQQAAAAAAAAAALVTSGPLVFGQQLSLGSILMSQNVSLLRDSVCRDSRLEYKLLKWIFEVVQNVRYEIDKVSEQLDLIHKEIQFKIHPPSVVFGPPPPPPPLPPLEPVVSSSKGAAASGVANIQQPSPSPYSFHQPQPHHPAASPSPQPSQPHQFRPTVINGPYVAGGSLAAHPPPYYSSN